ncbi:DEAD/DEAH box helicase [Peribacillus sp. FSL H8-0477]|uniref:DEAD/DEAH box helicase n=1 Tax=Peribacillus sp. FSL H8-0477 TaxID=2921388 RepID=UPI0030FA77CA
MTSIPDISSTEPSPFSYSKDLHYHLSGRSLLALEIPFELDLLTEHLHQGYVKAKFGVMQDKGKWLCGRCGSTDQRLFASFPCSLCNSDCTYCRACIMMGRVSECAKLYTWSGPERVYPIPGNVMAWEGTLSEGQQTASDQVVTSISANAELLVWAVCGAGKTEVLFRGIESALITGKRVCIATPRTDVVLELAPRLKTAFPHVEVAALYGGSEDRHKQSPLVVSTTHQLFRFERAFDVIIIDEVDAFPYSADASLQYAVSKAKKANSSTIYLTATPSKKMQHDYKIGKLSAVKIPARFHRQPIPVPELKWGGNWQKQLQQGKLDPELKRWTLHRLQQNIPILLFFPSIAVMDSCLPLFQQLHPLLQSVHSADPNRKEKVISLRLGELPGLLTTTILERGVTIHRLEVAVIGAEHDVFSESALVQIAGRVGRSKEHCQGNVTFFHYGKSKDMVEAVSHIRRMNEEAHKRGLLDV